MRCETRGPSDNFRVRDCHVHVFCDPRRFPLSPDRPYTPPPRQETPTLASEEIGKPFNVGLKSFTDLFIRQTELLSRIGVSSKSVPVLVMLPSDD